MGSTRALTDSNGDIVQRYDYTPYGQTTASAAGFSNPYQYTGRELDQSGLYYYRARYYSPQMGRFISEDPIGLAGGLNVYGYVGGNPVNYVDPYGLIDERPYGPSSPNYGSKGPFGITRMPPSEMNPVSRGIGSKVISYLTAGFFKLNKFGKIVPKGPIGIFIAGMKPMPTDCAELDCDGDGIIDYYQRQHLNQCLRPDIYGAGLQIAPIIGEADE